MSKVLIVVDMLEGFCTEGYPLYCGEDARKIIPFIQNKIKEYNENNDTIIFIADNHNSDDEEFQMFPPHCIKGTKEAEVLPELLNLAKNKKVIPKKRYSGFHETSLDEDLKRLDPDLVEVVGVCTNICVFFTVEGLRNRDYKVRVYKDAVASFDKKAHQFALQQMKDILGAEVI